MKRYGIPLLVIAILAVGAFAWRSSVAKHEKLRRQRKAHIDSLRQHQPSRTMAMVAVSEESPAVVADTSMRIDSGTFAVMWLARNIPMPDSIRPSDFSENSVKPPHWDDDESGPMDAYYIQDKNGNLDTVASTRAYFEETFVEATVMKMLLRHLTQPADADEFSRCPSGYFYAHGVDYQPAGDSVVVHSPAEGWTYGDVYFGAGCNDTMLCKYRIQYPKRIVEMKDPMAAHYVSLRTYEMMHFGRQMAEAIRQRN